MLHRNGDLSASGAKPFVQPHAKDPSKEIVYIAAEAPEPVVMLRGTARLVEGNATIEIPEHFRVVAAEQGVQVQVTPHSADTFGLAVVEEDRERIVVKELRDGKGNFTFGYLVTAIRSGFEHHRPARYEPIGDHEPLLFVHRMDLDRAIIEGQDPRPRRTGPC